MTKMNNIILELEKSNYNIRSEISMIKLYKSLLNFYKDINKLLGSRVQVCADYANVNSNASYVANVGGNYNNNADNTGPFYVNVNNSASNTNTNIGARCVASNPYSGQHFITMSKIFEMLRSFTGSITSSMSIINISMKSCEYRSQRTRLILAKDIGKMLLAKERVSNLYKVLVESPLEPNRGYTINSNNLNLSGFGNMQIL